MSNALNVEKKWEKVNTLPREYVGVRKNTTFPGLLEPTAVIGLFRRTQIIRLLQSLAYHCKLENGFPSVRFGKHDKAWHASNRLQFRDPERYGATSVHIILHEYAHLWASVKREEGQKRRRSHGTKFRMCLDALLLIWRDKIRKDFMEYLGSESA
jgi:hypothetical protein